MRKAISIFLLGLLVSVQTPVGQLLKLPLLITHFAKHQDQEGLSLFEFMNEHYTSDHNDNDLQDDQQLPFKNMDYYAIGFAIVPNMIRTIQPLSFPEEKKMTLFEVSVPQQHLASIFHPPRV